MSKAVPKATTVNIKSLFLGLQQEMRAAMVAEKQLPHPVVKGTATEVHWVQTLQAYLPARYCATTAFVLDSRGNISEQQDLVIYDRFYSPFLFNHGGAKYVPAEGVYGVFEIKQTLDKDHLIYAAQKVASVRRLHRTSAPITHAGGTFKPRRPIPILAGLLCTNSGWVRPEPQLAQHLKGVKRDERLDLVCALASGTYECVYKQRSVLVTTSKMDAVLITFFLRLISRLQEVGTVPAMDYTAYGATLG